MQPVANSTPSAPNTRRRILRAGFAAPVISTVASGSALAATSTTCFAAQIASNFFPPVTPLKGPADTYLRVQLGSVTSGSTTTYYVDGSNVAALALAPKLIGGFTPAATKVKLFNVDTNSEVGGELAKPTTGYTPTSGQYAVLRFNSSGQIVGVGRSGSTGLAAVTASCWGSAAP